MISLTATDNCGAEITVEGVDVLTEGPCANSFGIVRTWTFTDACGNTSSVSQNISVNDNIPPVAPAAPADITAVCASEVPAMVSLTATDNCGAEITVEGVDVTTAGTCPNSFGIVRTWTFTDACGNTSSVSQNITVNDNVPPVAPAAPADITSACAADLPAMVSLTATDNCGDEITVEGVDVTVPGACANSSVTTRTWTFTDACGNSSSVSQTITINDNVAPTFDMAAPEDITVTCSAIPAAATLTATDNCEPTAVAVTMTESTVAGACAGSYTLTRTWTATDACGNTATEEQIITVQDVDAPTFDTPVPADATVSCDAIPAAATITASDNCGTATVEFAEVITAGTCEGNYTITRTWTATDVCGNATAGTQVLTVTDTAGPTIDGVLESPVNATCALIPVVPTLTFIDNCSTVGEVTFTEEMADETVNSYTIIRTWTVSDSCGNQSVFTQEVFVTVADGETTIPSESCNEDTSTVELNNLLPAGTPTDGVWVDVDGTGVLNGSVFSPFGLATGTYTLQYQIDGTCPRTINIEMAVNEDCFPLGCGSITVHNAFSPNNDGINDHFAIANLEQFTCYPTNTVEIYNRWGVLVYDTTQYDNALNSFKGISEGRATINKGAELPTGTYFYTLQYTTSEGQTIKKDGYLYLSR